MNVVALDFSNVDFVLDTALARSDLDVSGITPGRAPRVSDEEVVRTVFVTVTDNGDTVIELVSATGSDNTTVVELEGILVSLDSDGSGTVLVDGLSDFGGTTGDRASSGDRSGVALAVVGAGSVSSGVWVFRFKGERVGNDPVKSSSHVTTVATKVSVSVAVNQHLFREGLELARLSLGTFDGSDSGESPARTALTLVLDGVDKTVLSGIVGIWGSQVSVELSLRGLGTESLVSLEVGVLLLELSLGEIGELVQFEGGGLWLGVEGVDVVVVGSEDGHSVGLFGVSSVGTTLLSLPHVPGSLDWVLAGKESRSSLLIAHEIHGSDYSQSSGDGK